MIIHMDGRTGKHLAKGLRTYVQRITVNILADEVERYLLSCVFFYLHSVIEE